LIKLRTLSQLKENKPAVSASSTTSSLGELPLSKDAPLEKSYVPVFVPMGSAKGATMGCRGEKGVPVHTTDIITRKDVLEEITDPSMHSGNFGAVYSAWTMSVVCFILMFVTWVYLSVYVAGIFAYLTGYYYSERLLNNAWGIGWFKGKTLLYST
jgi:hypothetical protein